jgi:hypothetical protein
VVEQLDERVFGKCGVNRSSGEGDRQLIKHVKRQGSGSNLKDLKLLPRTNSSHAQRR